MELEEIAPEPELKVLAPLDVELTGATGVEHDKKVVDCTIDLDHFKGSVQKNGDSWVGGPVE